MRYFAYGSNMSRSRLEARLGRVVDLGRAQCSGRLHRFSKLGLDGTGKGNIEAVADGVVWGVVYEIEPVQFERLVEIESGYRVIELELELGIVRSFEALRVVSELAPRRAYLEHYVRGIREHAIPEDYLAQVLGEFATVIPLDQIRRTE